MATHVWNCGFECQVSGAGTHIAPVGTWSFSTSTKRTGAASFRANPTAAHGYFNLDSTSLTGGLTMTQRTVGRFYVNFASLPTGDTWLVASVQFLGSAIGVGFKNSDSTIRGMHNNGGNTFSSNGATVTTGTWYRVDFDINTSANPWKVDVRVDGVALNQLTTALAANTHTYFAIGIGCNLVATTTDAFFEDCVISQTGADYPLGPGEVQRLLPNADGTHSVTGTNIIRGTTAAPTGGGNVNGSSDTYTYVDEVPLGGGGDFINQQTTAGTEYAEIAFENTPSGKGAPRSVSVIIARHESTTSTGAAQHRLRDTVSAAEDTFLNFNAAGSTSLRYTWKCYAAAPGGAAWTSAILDGIVYRFGYSSDADPDMYADGVMLEAEYLSPYTASMSGGITPSGTLKFSVTKVLAGAITSAGTLVRKTYKSFTGGITPTGALTAFKVVVLAVSGSIASSGTLVRKAIKQVSGSVASSGTLKFSISKLLSGGITPAGALTPLKATFLTFTGTIASTGALKLKPSLTLTGTITTAGGLLRGVQSTLRGTITSAGTLIKRPSIRMTGSIASSGALSTGQQALRHTAKVVIKAGTNIQLAARRLFSGNSRLR